MKKRKDSFLGLHLDYHASPKDGIQGKTLTEDDIREICHTLKPDFIQIDCKGHPGWASYPSKIGNAMPEFAQNTLALWRRVTREENVALYMHYSGVYDRKYCSEHPEERVMNADGSFAESTTRTNGKYVDDIVIPQMLELAEDYQVDGIWVDGDCWMAASDFSKETLESFEKETGISLNGKLPASRDDEYYDEYREYNRELFRRYVRHYTDEVHKKHPDFQIASNWAFSDHMPEEVSANVDFLSGDLNPANSFNSARYAGRALAQHEHPWDLMSWNFRNAACSKSGYVAKHPTQIMQEAASVIALGGAYQNYVTQERDGSPNMTELRRLEDVYDFIRERQEFCFRGKPMHQAALLLSTYDRHKEAWGLYSRNGYERVMGACALLCDIGQSLEIVCEHTLRKYINEYKMIVIPELYSGLEEKTVKALYEYAENGGHLVLLGKNTCNVFAKYENAPFSVREVDEFLETEAKKTFNGHMSDFTRNYKPYLFTMNKSEYGAAFSPCEIVAEEGVVECYLNERRTTWHIPLAMTVPYGKGTVTPVGFDIGDQYLNGTQYLQRDLMRAVADRLYLPTVRLEKATGRLEIVALEKDGSLMVQLVNANGSHSNAAYATDDLVSPVLDIEISVELEKEPKAMILQPEGRTLDFKYKNGRAYTSVPRVEIHSVVEVKK